MNAGSVGMPLDGDLRASYDLAHQTPGEAADWKIEIRRVPYPVEAAIAAYDNGLRDVDAGYVEIMSRQLRTARDYYGPWLRLSQGLRGVESASALRHYLEARPLLSPSLPGQTGILDSSIRQYQGEEPTMLHPQTSDTRLTTEEDDVLFWLSLADDAEDVPWMVRGDLQFWSASSLAHSLRNYAHEQRLPWYVASMLPIQYVKLPSRRKQVLAPDLFVAIAPEHSRNSFDVDVEGGFPPFVLEVDSPSSTIRDFDDKLEAYEKLGAREYALFTPRADAPSVLQGFRRNDAGWFEVWSPDADGGLWSDVLGLRLVVRGTILQAQTPDGRLLRTPEEAEAEIIRLRRELERYEGRSS